MHDLGGLFCKTGSIWKIAGKKCNGLDLEQSWGAAHIGPRPVRRGDRLVERLGLNVLLGREEAQVEAGPGTRSGRSGGWRAAVAGLRVKEGAGPRGLRLGRLGV